MYLLDTSVYSQPLKQRPVESVLERWQRVGDGSCSVSVFCEVEVLQGVLMAASSTIRSRYEAILRGRLEVIPFGLEEGKVYAELQAALVGDGRRRPAIDLCIAATAIRHSLVLATLNAKDFAPIPGLMWEDWSA